MKYFICSSIEYVFHKIYETKNLEQINSEQKI